MSQAQAASAVSAGTPRSAYSVLERRATAAFVGLLVVLAALAWWSTIGTSRSMSMMAMGLAQVGSAMAFSISVPLFLGMWVVMMVAMMFPTIAPVVLLHRMVVSRRGEGPLLSIAFGAGYLLVWAAVGFIPLIALLAFRSVSMGAAWVAPASGAVLVIAGVYQFTRWKETCQKACQSPMTFLMTHDFGRGAAGAARTGWSHGLYCLGCCWALMAVLFVVGLMNLAWMAAIAAIFLVEKHWHHGLTLARVVGAVLIAGGVAVLVHPALLGALAGS
ncbi:MAG TPA: DUF2182 domain-containing protein [Candidatus Dormibacteraeota bacterium]